MKSIVFVLAMIISMNMTAQEVTKVLYVGDPMCSWCYGISGEIEKLQNHYGDRMELEVLTGGLRPGGGEAWDSEFTGFLKHHWEEVGKRSGAEFSFDLLSWDDFNYDTEPSCRSVVIAKELGVEDPMKFFSDVQRKFYYDNKDPNELGFYQEIVDKHALDFDAFTQLWNDPKMKEKTYAEFARAQKLGVRGFPHVMIEENGQLVQLSAGYSTAEQMIRIIDSRK